MAYGQITHRSGHCGRSALVRTKPLETRHKDATVLLLVRSMKQTLLPVRGAMPDGMEEVVRFDYGAMLR